MTASDHFVVAISASPARESSTARVAEHVLGEVREHGCSIAHIRLRDIPPEALVTADRLDRELAQAISLVEQADGLVIATPIYKASYTGLLKIFLDGLPQFGLAGKTVLPLATGGSLAHALALDYSLRPVLSSMGVRHVVQGLFITSEEIDRSASHLDLRSPLRESLSEAIHHFKCSLTGAPGDRLLGHPRPVRSQSECCLIA